MRGNAKPGIFSCSPPSKKSPSFFPLPFFPVWLGEDEGKYYVVCPRSTTSSLLISFTLFPLYFPDSYFSPSFFPMRFSEDEGNYYTINPSCITSSSIPGLYFSIASCSAFVHVTSQEPHFVPFLLLFSSISFSDDDGKYYSVCLHSITSSISFFFFISSCTHSLLIS